MFSGGDLEEFGARLFEPAGQLRGFLRCDSAVDVVGAREPDEHGFVRQQCRTHGAHDVEEELGPVIQGSAAFVRAMVGDREFLGCRGLLTVGDRAGPDTAAGHVRLASGMGQLQTELGLAGVDRHGDGGDAVDVVIGPQPISDSLIRPCGLTAITSVMISPTSPSALTP